MIVVPEQQSHSSKQILTTFEHGFFSCSIVLPVHNEAENLPHLFRSIDAFIIIHPSITFEVIVVDDGSDDESRSILDAIQLSCPLIVVSHATNQGYGAALRSGFSQAKSDWIFFMDSDLQFDINTLRSFFPYVHFYDAIIGYRERRADNFVRKANAKLWSLWTSHLFNISVTDINCAFKIFRSDILKGLELQSDSALINTEILAGLSKCKSDILELPVPHFPRTYGKQSGASLAVVKNALIESITFLFR